MRTRYRTTLALTFGGAAIFSACDSDDVELGAEVAPSDAGDAAQDSEGDTGESRSDASDSGAIVDASPEPVACAVTPCAVQIAAGASSACVLLSTGAVQCWGSNEQGELGRGAAGAPAGPGPVIGLSDVVQISGSATDTGDLYCVLRSGGTTACWGANPRGTLGRVDDTGVSTASSPIPEPVSGLDTATAIFAGTTVSCATLAGTDIACWGDTSAAQIPSISALPGPPIPATRFSIGAQAVALGIADRGTVALTSNAEVLSWGLRGELLGEGTSVLGREVSTDVAPPAKVALEHVSAVATSFGHACAIANGRVVCWGPAYGSGGDYVYPTPVGVGGSNVVAQTLALGPSSACATLSDGTARCWGDNGRGQLGSGTIGLEPLPVTVKDLTGRPVRMAVMSAATCSVLASGAVQCWGQNDRAQLGTGVVDALAHLEPRNVVLSP